MTAQKEQQKYKLSNEDVKQLQFYTQYDITFKNGTKDGSTKTEDGELVIKNESSLNTVFIESGTQGIVERVEGDILYVSFEEGKNIKFKASLSVFNRDATNLIDYIRPNTVDEIYTATNIAEVNTKGFELNADYNFKIKK